MHETQLIQISGDKDLALRIESFVGYDNAKYIDALKRICPDGKFGTFEFEGGVSCFAGTDLD